MMPARIRPRLMIRPAFAGSPISTMPRMAVPTAPTPTQTAYAVPTGSDFIAMPSRPRLMTIASTVPTVGHNLVKPSVYFSPIAQPISNSPASTRINQFIIVPSSLLHELGFQLHRPESIDLAVDVMVLVDQPDVAHLGSGLERGGGALDLEVLGDRHRIAVGEEIGRAHGLNSSH